VEVAGLGKCSYLVGKRKVFIKDEAQVASRVGGVTDSVVVSSQRYITLNTFYKK